MSGKAGQQARRRGLVASDVLSVALSAGGAEPIAELWSQTPDLAADSIDTQVRCRWPKVGLNSAQLAGKPRRTA